jgi:hypothetical protein
MERRGKKSPVKCGAEYFLFLAIVETMEYSTICVDGS